MTRPTGRSRHFAGAIAALAVVAGFVVGIAPVYACSCVDMDLATRMPEAEGSFVGTYVDRDSIGEQQAAWTFEVERVVKGSFGPTAIVRTSAFGASCGIELLDGPRTGLLLDRAEDGVWESGLCQQVSPAELLAFSPRARPPDPSVMAIDPTGLPGWAFVLIGAAIAVAALAAVARRPRAHA
jgi:hypothetical protein